LHRGCSLSSRAARRVRLSGVLSLAKLAGADQRYYLDQASGRVDHAGSVSSGVEDYYLAGPEAAGRWSGSAAGLLGLRGRVGEEALREVLSQQDPRSGVKLAGPAARARVPGFDLMFSVPKSASVLFGVGDERLQRAVLEAQERAVAAGVAYLERHACRTRMGAGGHMVVQGAGFVGAAFGHRTSRAGDPQVHTHVLVANATRRADGLWGTLDARLLYAHAKTAGYVHEAVFRAELGVRLGVRWRAARNGIGDVDGVSEAVIDAFSRRRAEIDQRVAEWGRSSAGARQSAALATRARKDYRVTPATLAPEWRRRAEELGLDRRAIETLLGRPARGALPDDEVAERLVSARGLTARASTFDRRDVVQAFAAAAVDGASVEQIEVLADGLLGREEVVTLATGAGGHVQRADVIRRADGRIVAAVADAPRYSTVELLATEQQVVDSVLARRGERAGVVDDQTLGRVLEARPTLGDDQASMVRRLCTDGDGVQVVVGPPGTGKTFALDAAREAWQAAGYTVCGAAVARQAARGMWDTAGIQSTSVAALLAELGRGAQWGMTSRTVLVVDEAGMLGTRDLARLLDHAGRAGAKVVLVGDHHQLPEIDAGGLFRALVARTDPVRLTVNRRQREPHARELLDLWRQARVRDAVTIAKEHGELVMAATAEQLLERMVADYCQAIGGGEDAVMITQRRADARDLNARARAWLDAHGRLGGARVALAGGEFAVGDRVVLKLNDRGLRVENGNRGHVVNIDTRAGVLEVELSGGRLVGLPGSYLTRRAVSGDPSLLHGYAGTAHIAQGLTTGRAFVLGSDIAYREWGYVAWSRARLQTRFYVCEPDIDELAAEHHTAVPPPRDAFEEVVGALERSQAQHAAFEQLDHAAHDRPHGAHHPQQPGDDDATGREHRDDLRPGRRDATPLRSSRVKALRAAGSESAEPVASRVLAARRAPPAYLVGELGERPLAPDRAAAWDRAVALIERYRLGYGVASSDDALGPRPRDLRDRLAWHNARRDLQRARRQLTRRALTRSVGRAM